MKKKTVRQLKAQLDKVFSLWIRNRGATDGYNQCFTCIRTFPVKELQCGHYVSRSYTSTRYHEQNCHPQCVSCNVFKKGNMNVYALRIINEYGVKTLWKLDELRRVEKRFTTQELEKLIEKYKAK